MKIVTVVGARPQFVKAAVISRLLRQRPGIEELLVHTGQHYSENMSSVFLSELAIPEPAFRLNIGSGPHGQQTGRMLEAIEKVLLETKPDCVLIYGDTNSTLAGALAAAKLHIPLAHVEAGLRSFNRKMPEEINRIVADHLSTWLFAPTATAVRNLRQEGRPDGGIFLVGDVMYDAVLRSSAQAADRLNQWPGLRPREYLLATLHRAENTDDPARLLNIFEGLHEIAQSMTVVLPLHPRTRALLGRGQGLPRFSPAGDRLVLDETEPNGRPGVLLTEKGPCPSSAEKAGTIRLLEPVGYVDMLALEKNARLIVTDSGGVQKEAFFHRVPCVTLRDETEWIELVELGWNRLVPPTSGRTIADSIKDALRHAEDVHPAPADLYGGGQAGQRIVEALTNTCKIT